VSQFVHDALFFIVPAWILCVLAGIGLLCLRKFQGVGIYIIGISTAATVASLLLSTAVLFVAPRLVCNTWDGGLEL
jgi:hypothetical protein